MDGAANGGNNGILNIESHVKDGKGSRRSHRSRNSGGFLLSNALFEPRAETVHAATGALPRQRSNASDHKGKSTLRSPEERPSKRRPNLGPAVGSSPLAGNVTNAATEHDKAGGDDLEEDAPADKAVRIDNTMGTKPTTGGWDVDSAQIVNLALNLSESRRNASRRMISSPIPPSATGFVEAGGSLRYHMQQQRRTSRNVSPKPERGERTMSATSRIPSAQRINNPLQAAFDTQSEGAYQYHFSASTLARAEKAKNAIELMAHYRRLLLYVPPLKPQTLGRTTTASEAGSAPGSATASTISPFRTSSNTNRPLGREYNPLQYVRNRKVRARNSKAIDGEQQGFGDLAKVSSWVDQVAQEASSGEYQTAGCLQLPPFSKAANAMSTPHTSPQSTVGRSNTLAPKVKRPRIDWVTNPADMLADVFWLEQDDNKKMIEDCHGARIFPRGLDLKRPISHRSDEPEAQKSSSPAVKREEPDLDLRIDTKLPEFKSIKPDSQKFPEITSARARQKLRDVRDAARIHHGHNGSRREARQFLRSRSKSDSDSSDSDAFRQRRERSGTADSHDRGEDILEKQMLEMLARKAKDTEWSTTKDIEGHRIIQSIEAQKPMLKDGLEKARAGSVGHSRSPSIVKNKRDSWRNGSSGRASLEVPGRNPRGSLEDLDSTAPNSPQTRAARGSIAHIPSIAMDLSSPHSKYTSPTRRPLSRVRSKIRPLHEQNHHSSHPHGSEEETRGTQPSSKEQTAEIADAPETHRRSTSLARNITSRKTDDSLKPLKTGSLRSGKVEESSGIKGFLRNARNPVTRVSDFLWKKEAGHGTASGFSTDESDIEGVQAPETKAEKQNSRESSTAVQFDDDEAVLRKEKPSYLSDMPVFTSPFERRGRTSRTRSDENSNRLHYLTEQQRTREERRKSSRAHLLDPTPHINVHSASPNTSPDSGPVNRHHRDSSLSDLDSRRGSFPLGVARADSRLNAVLGIPGKGTRNLPVTGLATLETTQDRRPSMDGKRQWSIPDRGVSAQRGPMTRQEIARVRALLLSSGIKAKEITRRAAEAKDLRTAEEPSYRDVAALAKDDVSPVVPKSQEHILAARILSSDIQLSSRLWQESADTFCNTTVNDLLNRVEDLQTRLVDNLTPMTRQAADETDEVSKDLVTGKMLEVKRVGDKMDKMMRRRRRRFRWLRRGGWVLVEWALVGVMWYVWFMVVLARVVMGVGRGVLGSLRWLFFV
jgi:hypothetical protein